jgi:hypothetical protein
LGSSQSHARSVALVLSLMTGDVSPQFHLKYDDFFETVQETKSLPQSKWQQLAQFVTKTGAPMKEITRAKAPRTRTQTPTHPRVITHENPFGFDFIDLSEADGEPTTQNPEFEGLPPLLSREQAAPEEPRDPERHHHPDSNHRSTRQPNPPCRLIETAYAVLDETDAVDDYETQLLAEDPIAFTASKSGLDTLHFNDAMNADDSAEFKTAMLEEVNTHTENDHWEVWEKVKVPAGQDVLPGIWAFKRKRQIDTRDIYKDKAHLNIHGGMQKHDGNYWETYSPVVNLFSIGLCLILILLFKWKTRQIDLVIAFPHTDVECALFMHLPQGRLTYLLLSSSVKPSWDGKSTFPPVYSSLRECDIISILCLWYQLRSLTDGRIYQARVSTTRVTTCNLKLLSTLVLPQPFDPHD